MSIRLGYVVAVTLLLGACGPKPSPMAGIGAVARLEIRHRTTPGSYGAAITTVDTAIIGTILRLARVPGDWNQSWNTLPAGEHSIAMFAGDSLLGTLRFAPTFLLAQTPAGAKMRSIDSAEYGTLLRATTWWPPRAVDYPTADTLVGASAPIDYTFDPDARRFRTTLEEARSGPADLAGHYEFVVWGCGTQCTSHVILDLRTGRTYDDTLVNFSCENVVDLRESALVVAIPETDPEVRISCPTLSTRYYLWTGTKLEQLHR